MLSKEVTAVLDHYLKEGLSKTAIANKLGITLSFARIIFEKGIKGMRSSVSGRMCAETVISSEINLSGHGIS